MSEEPIQDEEEFEIVEIDHPVHGVFELDVPAGMPDEEVLAEVQQLDLDLLLGIPGGVKVGETDIKLIQDFENSAGAGKRGGKWYTHKSIEGGTDSLAYGHKLTPEEATSGFVTIGDEQVDYIAGLSQAQAEAILNQDASFAQKIAVASLAKVGMEGDSDKVSALTSLIFNVGSGSWAGSKAKKFLESGNMEDFMHEAFSEEAGWVNINGEKSRGLVRRRAAEGELFTRTQVDTADNSGGFSFISSAQAHEIENPPENDLVNEVSRARETLEALGKDAPVDKADKAAKTFDITPTTLTTFAEHLLRGASDMLLGTELGEATLDASDLTSGDVSALRGMEAYLKKQGRTKFTADDWKALIGTDLAETGKTGVSVTSKIMSIMTDPVANMAMTIGAGEFKVDKDGNTYLEDIYDYNVGPEGKATKKDINELGFISGLSKMWERDDIDAYTKLRIMGFIIHPKRKGNKFRIYLGEGKSN